MVGPLIVAKPLGVAELGERASRVADKLSLSWRRAWLSSLSIFGLLELSASGGAGTGALPTGSERPAPAEGPRVDTRVGEREPGKCVGQVRDCVDAAASGRVGAARNAHKYIINTSTYSRTFIESDKGR